MENLYHVYLKDLTNLSEKSIKEYKFAIKRISKKLNLKISILELNDIAQINYIMNTQEFITINKKENHVYSAALNKYKDLLQCIQGSPNLNYFHVESLYSEGDELYFYTKAYERNKKLRKEVIRLHGLICLACHFDFEKVYGELGKDYIEIHHLKPLSFEKKEHKVDPKEDLVPLCANCHRMVHRKKTKVLPIEKLQEIIQKARTSK